MGIANITSSWAKLLRANMHRKAIGEEIKTFSQEDRAKAGKITYGHDGAWYVVYIDPVPALSSRVALIVGDCLNNVRAALDHLVWQLVIREEKEPKYSHCFPICETRDKFRDEVKFPNKKREKRSPLHGIPVGGDAWTIIEQAQPFNRSQPKYDVLTLIQRLTNIDKHRTLLMQMTFLERELLASRIQWKAGFQPVQQEFRLTPLSNEQPTEIARFLFAEGIEPNLDTAMEVEGDIQLTPYFGEVDTQADVLLLNAAIGYVGYILQQVSALPRVEGPSPPPDSLTQEIFNLRYRPS